MKKVFTIFLAFLMVFTLAACKKDKGDGGKSNEVTAVKITGKAQVKLGGADLQLTAVVTPSTATTTFTWESSDPTIATVDQNGLVHGVKLGMVKISVITANNKVGTKSIKVTDEERIDYPDLQGYTIRIVHAANRLYEYDPFFSDGEEVYRGLDIMEAQASWEAVENDYNCHIQVVPYPSDAAWGDSRWDFVISQAINNRTEFDVCVITDSFIPRMVSGGALYSMSSWYDKYGNDFMDYAYIKSGTYKGQLYSLTASRSDVYNILGVNLGLLDQVREKDPTIKEPAEMFMEDNWSFDSFYAWCKKVQNVLDSQFSTEDVKFYTLSGYSTYYWAGMLNASGVTIADTATYKVNILGDLEDEVAKLVKQLKTEGIMDPADQVDSHVTSWVNNHAVINTGEFWFVNDTQRWPKEAWGEGEATRYGYAPYPSKTGTKDDYKLAVFGGQTWVMPIGINYSNYGEDCTPENIYHALMDYLQRTEKAYKSSDSYDEEMAQFTINSRAFSSEASVKAISWINLHSTQINFFDPMSYEGNQVANLYNSDFANAAKDYFNNVGGDQTWAEAVGTLQETMDKAVLTIYG